MKCQRGLLSLIFISLSTGNTRISGLWDRKALLIGGKFIKTKRNAQKCHRRQIMDTQTCQGVTGDTPGIFTRKRWEKTCQGYSEMSGSADYKKGKGEHVWSDKERAPEA